MYIRNQPDSCLPEIVCLHQNRNIMKILELENNPWRLNGHGDLQLVQQTVDAEGRMHLCRLLYWIPADQITDRAVPDWLAQIAEKSWTTFPILGGLCRAFELLVGYRGKQLSPLRGHIQRAVT